MSAKRRAVAIIAVCIAASLPGRGDAAVAQFGDDADTHVDSKNQTTNYGTLMANTVGTGLGNMMLPRIRRGLLHFDIAAMPANAQIRRATLRLFINSTSIDPLGLALDVFQLTDDFDETTVTWTTQPSIVPLPHASATMNTLPGDWFEMDVTSVLIAIRGGMNPGNASLRVAPSDEMSTEDRTFTFLTKESDAGAQRPQLVIEFLVPASVPIMSRTGLGLMFGCLLALGVASLLYRSRVVGR